MLRGMRLNSQFVIRNCGDRLPDLGSKIWKANGVLVKNIKPQREIRVL